MMIWSSRRPRLERQLRRLDRREHHALVDDLLRGLAEIAVGVLLHLRHDELLVEGAAVDADAHGCAVVDRHLADRRELLVTPRAGTDVARVDPVFVERARAVGVAGEEQVAVVVEVADERGGAAGVEHPLLDLGHCRSGVRHVDGDAHHLRSRLPQLDDLLRGALRVSGVGHGHRLDDDRRAAADLHVPDLDANGLVKLHRHTSTIVPAMPKCPRADRYILGSGHPPGARC